MKEIKEEIADKSSLKKSISELEGQINSFSKVLFSSAKFLSSEFKIGTNLKEFFESFDIGTGERKDISLRLRGDGIRAKFIPEMLDFLNKLQESKKHYIWGFEEPENSAEYKNQRTLADEFKNKYSENKQIFLTTHSEEFLSIYDGKDVDEDKRRANLYYVKKVSNKEFKDFSVIELFDVEKQSFEFATTKSSIEEDIGSSMIRAKYSKELSEKENRFLEEKKVLESERLNNQKQFEKQISRLNNVFPEKVFICEDENATKVWESFFKKFEIEGVTIIPSEGCTVDDVETWIRGNVKRNPGYVPKVFRSIDRDGLTQLQVDFLEKELREKNARKPGIQNYEVRFLPVNELENFAVLCEGSFTDELLDENLDKLGDKFALTVDSSLKQNFRKFSNKKELFDFYSNPLLKRKIEREAKSNIRKYFPGKDIKRLKANFNAEVFLINLPIDGFPDCLTTFLKEVKSQFEK